MWFVIVPIALDIGIAMAQNGGDLSKVDYKTILLDAVSLPGPLKGLKWVKAGAKQKKLADNIQKNEVAPKELSANNGNVAKGADKLPIYDARTLKRMGEDAFHNFPASFEKSILSQKPIVRSNGRSEFLQQGTINGKEGVFHITTDNGGKMMRHRAFIPKSDWARYSKRWELPGIDGVAK